MFFFRRAPSPKPALKRSPSPRARASPANEQHKANECKAPSIKPMLKPASNIRAKFKSKESKKEISDQQPLPKPTGNESRVPESEITTAADIAQKSATNSIPNKVRFADEKSDLEIVESEVEIAAEFGFRLEPTSRSASPADSLEEIQTTGDENSERENLQDKPQTRQVWDVSFALFLDNYSWKTK